MFDSNLLKLDGMKGVMGALVVLALLQAAATLGQVLMLSSVMASLWAGQSIDSATPGLLAFLACFVAGVIVGFAQDTMLDRYSAKQARSIQETLLQSVFDGSTMLAEKAGAGHVATAATDGIDEVQSYIRIIPPKPIGIAALSLPLLVAVFVLDWVSGVILAIMLPVTILFMVMLGGQSAARAKRQYKAYTLLSNRFMDTLRGLPVLKAFGAAGREGASVFSFSERLRQATIRTLSTATLSSAVLDLCATFGVAAVAMMLAFRLMDGSMELSVALAALMLAPEYFKPIRAFGSDFHASLDGKNALADILDLTEAAQNSEEPSGCVDANIAWDSSSALTFSEVSCAYGGEKAAIDRVSFTVRGFERIALIGASGAGKTTLANMLAGVLASESGQILLDGAPVDLSGREWKRLVRAVPQQPYIFRATLRDNVKFYAPDASDEDVLNAVESMGLSDFVATLPQGLDTMVGSGERGLSGGQAHRVALARILLDDAARILVFDEPTAHLDIETELDLKPFMLKAMEGKLVFFATHRMHWVDDMDRVFVLERGSLTEDVSLRGRSSDASAAPQFSQCFPVEGRVSAGGEPGAWMPEAIEEAPGRRPSASSAVDRLEVQAEPDGKASGRIPKWLRDPVSRYKRSVIIALSLGVVAAACAALLMFASGYLISATATPGMTLFAIMVPIAFVQIFGLARPFCRYAERLVSHDWVLRVTSDLRLELYNSVCARIDDPVRSRATGEYLGLLSDDVAHLQNLYLRVAFPIAVALLLAVGACLLFLAFDWVFALAMLVCLALVALVVPAVSYAVTHGGYVQAKRKRGVEHVLLADDVMGARDWVYARRGEEAVAGHVGAESAIRMAESSARLAERALALASAVVLAIMACAVAAWASVRFGTTGDPNWIAAFVLGVFPLIESLTALPQASATVTVHAEAVKRLDDYVGQPAVSAAPVERRQGDARAYDSTPVVLEDVSYSYPTSKARVLDSITVSFEKGQSVAVLGRSGSGKSTLASVIRGVLRPDEGSVCVFGAHPSEGACGAGHGIGYMGQTPFLFNRTLRENLTLGVNEASDERLVEILRSIGLGAKFDSLEDGLDTIVGQTGIGVSGGEEHRLALARVLVADFPVVIVDEPFSALDPETERALLQTLLDSCAEKTLIVITHHLAGIERFDRVLFVEEGRISLDGAPSALMETSPYFRSLVEFDRDWMRS